MASKDVKYRILLNTNGEYFKIGKIIIRSLIGEFFYAPSQRDIVDSNLEVSRETMGKVSWHESGRVHVKTITGKPYILAYGKGERGVKKASARQKIREIGFQEILRDTILDFTRLPKLPTNAVKKIDVVFNLGSYQGSIEFIFCIISGRLIVKSLHKERGIIKPISDEQKSRLLDNKQRCLGHESDNADKLLQYSLFKYVGGWELSTNRKIAVAPDSRISRDIK